MKKKKQTASPGIKARLKKTAPAEQSVDVQSLTAELIDTRRKIDLLMRSVPDIIYQLDNQGRIIYINQVIEQYGHRVKQLLGKDFLNLVHPQDREKALYRVKERRTGDRKTSCFELRLLAKQRKTIPVEIKERRIPIDRIFILNAEGIYSSDKPNTDSFLGTIGVARDITERKQAEQDLLYNQERNKTLFDSAHDGIFFIEAGKIVSCNQRAEEIFQISRQQFQGKNLSDYSAHGSKRTMQKFLNQAIRGKDQFLEWVFARADGTLFNTEISLKKVSIAGQNQILVVVRDVTEYKFLENQLRQSQKMEAIGILAGGVAHDFNNLLTVIRGYTELLLTKLGGSDPLLPSVRQIDKAAERAVSLTKQLLAFSRRQILQPRVINLNQLIREMEKMLRRIIGEDIDFVTDLDEELGQIKADPGQIEQVVMNIVINARDAMEAGGKLIIRTRNEQIDAQRAAQYPPPMEAGNYVCLLIQDTGTGMDKETQTHIFEPFFTTKEKGKGTGLGLATVYGIVKQSGGFIWVTSESKQGSTFEIYLPIIHEESEEVFPKATGQPGLRGQETILIVEDDDDVRQFISETLKQYGYRILHAPDGETAISAYKEYKDPIHLVLTDVIMPKLSGRELVDTLLKEHKELKVLYMSGYTDNSITHRGLLEAGTNFIQKPFTRLEIIHKIREVLER